MKLYALMTAIFRPADKWNATAGNIQNRVASSGRGFFLFFYFLLLLPLGAEDIRETLRFTSVY
jgi:hypothetical protein